MTLPSVPQLVETIRQRNLLKPRRLAKLTKSLQKRFHDPNDLLQDMMRRGWLTPQQVGQLAGAPVNVPVGLPVPPPVVPMGLSMPAAGAVNAAPAIPVGQPVPPPYDEQKRRSRYRWFQWNLVGLAVLLGLGYFLWHVIDRQYDRLNNPTPDEEFVDRSAEAQEQLAPILDRYADPYADVVQLRQSLAKFRTDYPEVPQAVQAAGLLSQLDGPLDKLDRGGIPSEELFTGQPKNLVAVLGARRWRHWAEARQVAFSPDGAYVASAGDDGKLLVWVRKTGIVQNALNARDLRGLHFTLDGKALAGGDTTGRALLWQIQSAQHGLVQGPVAKPTASAVSLQGQLAASAADDASIKIWDTSAGEMKASLSGHRAPVRAIAFHPNQQVIASGSDDGQVRLFTVDGSSTIGFDGNSVVRAVAFSPDGRRLAAAGDDKQVRLFDLSEINQPKELERMPGHDGPITALAFSGDNRYLATASDDLTVKLWDIAKGGPFISMSLGKVYAVAFHRRTLATAGADGTVRLWNLIDKVTTQPPGEDQPATIPFGQGMENHLPGHLASASAVAFVDDRDFNSLTLASAGWDRALILWNLVEGRGRNPLGGHDTAITALAYSPAAKRLVTGSDGGVVKLWDVSVPSAPKEAAAFGPLGGAIQSLAFAPDGNVFAVGVGRSDNPKGAGELRLIGTFSHQEAIPACGHHGAVNAVAFDPSGRLVFAAGQEGVVILRGRQSGQERGVLQNDAPIDALAVSPTGKLLATMDRNRRLKFWDLEKMKERNAAEEDLGYVSGMVFTPDGKRLATAHLGGRVVLWDPETGNKLDEFPFPGPVRAIAAAPDSRHLATANANGTIYLLRLASPPPRRK